MKTATGKNPGVSIIIPAFNESLKIEECLKSISKSTYKKIEVILVDDCSTDNTSSLATAIARKNKVELKVISNKTHKERGASRNLGAKSAEGKFILFIDADMKVDAAVVADCVKTIEKDKGFGAVIIPELSYGEGFWAQCKSLEKRCYLGDNRIEAARFFEKKVFWKVGGWDEKMVSGEDWDLTRRIRKNYKVGRIKSFILHNEGNLRILKAAKKKFYYARVSGVYIEKNPLSILSIIFFVFRPAYIRNWKILLADPLHALGMFILKGAELMAGGAGFLVSKLPSL